MKKLLFPLAALILGWPTLAHAQQAAPRLLVRLTDTAQHSATTAGTGSSSVSAFAQLNHRLGAVQVKALNPGRPQAASTGPASPVYLIVLPPGTDAQQARTAYAQSGLFRYVEVDAVGHGGGGQGLTPNDNLYLRQWALKNTGFFSQAQAKPGADIKMEEAWAITQGDASVTVAIIDSGCKLDHPELSGRIWRNAREVPGNNVDDDQNGFVDDINGWNFVDGDSNLADTYGHGTNLAGIVGANGNNSVGYAGVNWGCKLMICKGLNAQSSGFYSWWAEAMYYAVNHGARVINMSLGGTSSSQTLQDAVDYATQRGVVVVAAMMNGNSNAVYYPAGLSGVIAVGATNPDDTRVESFFWGPTNGSSFGPHISLVAPGNYIYGLNHQSDTNYNTYWGGTSQAVPHVVGVASLLLTLKPTLTPAQIKSILQSSADDQVGKSTEDTPGWDQYYGHGRLNAYRALTSSIITGTTRAARFTSNLEIFPNPARHQLTLRTTDPRLLNQQVQLYNSVGQLVQQQLLTSLSLQVPLRVAPGVYHLVVAGVGHSVVVE